MFQTQTQIFVHNQATLKKTQINKNILEFERKIKVKVHFAMKITRNLKQKLYYRNSAGNLSLTTTQPILSY